MLIPNVGLCPPLTCIFDKKSCKIGDSSKFQSEVGLKSSLKIVCLQEKPNQMFKKFPYFFRTKNQ